MHRLPPGTLQAGRGEPIVLFHGILGTPLMWRQVLPPLATQYRGIALPTLGHHSGNPCSERPVQIRHLVDDAERSLDALGLDDAHLVGNSLGGWIALELARRGRARTVCAFSPAGMWKDGNDDGARSKLRATLKLARFSRPTLPFSARFAAVRRLALRDNAVYGERTSRADLLALSDAALNCSAAEDLLATQERFEPLAVACPIDIVWAAKDRIFPVDPFVDNARELLPSARHYLLDDVGHVPMFDNPELVANTILQQLEKVRLDSLRPRDEVPGQADGRSP